MDTFKNRLIQFRERQGLTRIQIADLLAIPYASIRTWETRDKLPSAAVIRLFEVLETIEMLAPAVLGALITKEVAK